MITQRKAANAVGGKTARACDSCLRKRAQWYCSADDAFLCRGCDASVHSANQLASRHERVRLGIASFKGTHSETTESPHPPPSWHQGFTRKARTPRQRKDKEEDNNANAFPLVPEMGSEEASLDESEEQLLYRVPVFDPFAAELCNVSNEIENVQQSKDVPFVLFNDNIGHVEGCELDNNIHGFLPSDMELAEFAADVESLLGTGLDEDSCGMEGLGLRGCSKEGDGIVCMDVVCFEGNRSVKVEDEELELGIEGFRMDATRETLDWNFDYESPASGEEEKVVAAAETKMMMMMNHQSEAEVRRKIVLKLNYEEVITAWDNQGSPWTTGTRPDFNPDDCLPDFIMGMWPADVHHPYGNVGGRGGDGGREARVSRYREKRRTRLFSKKIRYEVRKLNAEKRPRMKGRFVKRASFAGPSALPNYLINK